MFNTKYQSVLKFSDVWITSIVLILALPLAYTSAYLLFKSERGATYGCVYIMSFLLFFLPILRVKKYSKAWRNNLGLNKGKWPIGLTLMIGVGVGLGYFAIKSLVWGLQLSLDSSKINVLRSILALITLQGFASIVLGPFSEEVFIRGFLYGYMRSRIGVGFGLLVQAVIFAVLHLDLSFSVSSFGLVFEGIVVGFLLGILYEVSASLYPSILCHSTGNYILFVTELLKAGEMIGVRP